MEIKEFTKMIQPTDLMAVYKGELLKEYKIKDFPPVMATLPDIDYYNKA